MHAVDSRHVKSESLTTRNFNIRFFLFFYHSLLFFFKCKPTRQNKNIWSRIPTALEKFWFIVQCGTIASHWIQNSIISLYEEGCEIWLPPNNYLHVRSRTKRSFHRTEIWNFQFCVTLSRICPVMSCFRRSVNHLGHLTLFQIPTCNPNLRLLAVRLFP